MSKTKTTTGFVEKVLALFKAGDKAKLQSFFDRELKKLERSVQARTRNIENLQFKLQTDIERLDDQLVDARQSVEDAYQAITPEDVKTNADCDSFSVTYWANVKSAENTVTSIEAQIEFSTESVNKAIEVEQAEIDRLNVRITKITG
jgi:hypothetical protein